jgi:hypothetical protein
MRAIVKLAIAGAACIGLLQMCTSPAFIGMLDSAAKAARKEADASRACVDQNAPLKQRLDKHRAEIASAQQLPPAKARAEAARLQVEHSQIMAEVSDFERRCK